MHWNWRSANLRHLIKIGILAGMLLMIGKEALCSNGRQLPLEPDPALRHGTLKNGFQYFIRYNPEPEKRAMLFLVNKVGSILEEEDQLGLAHFIEHMNFNGTKHYPKKQLEDFLESAGVRFGADLNAYTSHDETVYQLPIPTDVPGMVDAGIGIVRDWAAETLLEEEEIDKERGVILEEARLGLGKEERMRRQYLSILLNGSRYAYRLPIGKNEIIENFKPATLRRFYKDWYRPNLQAIIVVGDIDVDAVEKEIKKRFKDLKNPRPERERKDYRIRLNGENHLTVVSDPEQADVSLNLMIKLQGTELKTETDFLLKMKRDFVAEMLSGRFNALDQQADKKFMQVGASRTPLMGGLDAFSYLVVPKEGQLEAAFKQGWRVIEQVLRYGFTKEELANVKDNYRRNMEASMKNAGKVHSRSFVQQYQELFLKGTAAPSLQWKYDFMQRQLDRISLEDLQDVFKSYIRDDNRHYLILCPENQRQRMPDEKTVLSWIQAVQQEPLEPYKELTVEGELLPQKPKPGSLVDRTEIDSLAMTVLRLSNGTTVYLKPTDYQKDQVVFNGFAPGGTSLSDSGNYVSAINSAPMVNMMGLGAYSPLELQKLLHGKMVGVGTFIGSRSQGVNGNAVLEDLETALQLLYLRFTAPRKDAVLFANGLTAARQSLSHKYSNPEAVFRDTLGYVLGGYHYRARPFTADRIDEIDLDLAFDFYKERFSDAAGFSFVFVGSFDVDSILPLLETYIGGLPSTHKEEKPRDLDIHIPAGRFSKVVRAGREDKASVQVVVSGEYDYTEENNLGIHFLGQILQARLLEVLREEASEVYSPSASASYHKFPTPRYSFNFSFGAAPGNVDHLLQLLEAELKSLRENGPSQQDIDKVKAAYVNQMEQSKQSNGFWLNYISGRLQNEDDLYYIFKTSAILEQITPAFLKQLAGKYLSGRDLVDFRLIPVE